MIQNEKFNRETKRSIKSEIEPSWEVRQRVKRIIIDLDEEELLKFHFEDYAPEVLEYVSSVLYHELMGGTSFILDERKALCLRYGIDPYAHRDLAYKPESYHQIAEKLGCSHKAANNKVRFGRLTAIKIIRAAKKQFMSVHPGYEKTSSSGTSKRINKAKPDPEPLPQFTNFMRIRQQSFSSGNKEGSESIRDFSSASGENSNLKKAMSQDDDLRSMGINQKQLAKYLRQLLKEHIQSTDNPDRAIPDDFDSLDEMLQEVLPNLSHEERFVAIHRSRLIGDGALTFKEIEQKLRTSFIYQRQGDAFEKIRRRLQGEKVKKRDA